MIESRRNKEFYSMFDIQVKKYVTAKNIIFFIIAILFLVFISKIKDIAILFFASYVIACSLNPLVDRLSQKVSRGLASSIVLGSALTISALFFIPIIYMGGHQIKSFLTQLPEHVNTVKAMILSSPLLKSIPTSELDLTGLLSSASSFTTKFVNNSINLSMEFASAIIYFLAACIIIYYFMADKEIVRKTYLKLFPAQMKEKAEEIIESISQKIGGYVLAQVVTMTSVGVIMTIGLALLKVDYAVLLGVLTAVFDIIPVVGPAIALVIILLMCYKMGGLTIALVIAVFAFSQWAENNLVRPYIFSKFLDLHPLIIYFFLFVTAQYLGVIGVIFAPAIAATVCVLIEELYIKNVN